MAALGTRKLKFEIGAVEHTAEVTRCQIVSSESDSDFVTFADAAAGGARDYALEIRGVQDAASASLWRQVWDNAGDEVSVTVMPYGNATPSATEPHYTGTVVIKEPDGVLLGGEANANPSARFAFEVTWEFTSKPTEVTA